MEGQSASLPLEAAVSRVEEVLTSLAPDITASLHHSYIEVYVPVDRLQAVAQALRDRLGYLYLSMVTGVDYPDRIEVVYLAFAHDHPHGVFIKTRLPREALPDCPSLTAVWPGAEFQEREVYDLMGVNFVGHPEMRRILTEDDFPGHPLRKDFSLEPDYVLMRHLRYGAEGSGPEDPAAALESSLTEGGGSAPEDATR